MRRYEYPFFADWFAISLRWLVLIGVAYSLVLANTFNYYLAAAVLAGILWNFLSTLLAIFNRRMRSHRILNVGFDFLGTCLLFFFSHGFFGPLTWVGLLNLFSAGIYFGWVGSLLMAVMISLLQVFGSLFVFNLNITGQPILMLTGFNLLSGLLFGLLSQQLYTQLRDHFKELRQKRSETDEKLRITERQKMRKLFKMIEDLNASLDAANVLSTALDLCEQATCEMRPESPQVVCAVLLQENGELRIGDSRGFPAADSSITLPIKGVLAQAADQSEAITLPHPSQDPELGKLLALRECQTLLILPLARSPEAYGMLIFGHPERNYFDGEQQDMLELIGQQASIAIQNAQLFHELESERDRLVRIQEEERKQLASELHDGPTQSVTGIAMRSEYLRRLVDMGTTQEVLTGELEQIETLARKTTQEIRHMLFTLRPLVLEKEGLLNALQTLAQRMQEVYQQPLHLELDEETARRLNLSKQKVVFRITEEAVNNARKHAQASRIEVRLHPADEHRDLARLEICDDGVGFDVNEVEENYQHRGSLGMVQLREQAGLVNGHLAIDSVPGEGTHVRVTIPLTEKAAEWLQSGSKKK